LTKISLYLDEHVQLALAESLRARGVDVLTTQEAGNICLSDVDQLIFAKENKRTLFSYNKRHFAKIHLNFIDKTNPAKIENTLDWLQNYK
jgi:hypothetical protein